MVTYLLRPKAKEDLKNIADFSFKKWGKIQEEAYLRMLQNSFQSISDNPRLGRAIDNIMPGLHRFLAGKAHHPLFHYRNSYRYCPCAPS